MQIMHTHNVHMQTPCDRHADTFLIRVCYYKQMAHTADTRYTVLCYPVKQITSTTKYMGLELMWEGHISWLQKAQACM